MAKILLADDSTHAQRMGTKILSAEGHEVTAVSNGQAAFKILDELAPDLIVADIFMPGRNGYELCQMIKSNPKWQHIPVLLTIGAMEPYDPSEGRKAHADGLITKPLESSDLIETIQTLLASAKKPGPSAAVKEEAPEEPVEVLPEEEITQAIPPPVALELPKEIAQQPVALFGELLEPTTPPAKEAASLESSSGAGRGTGEAFAERPLMNPDALEPETAMAEEEQAPAEVPMADFSAEAAAAWARPEPGFAIPEPGFATPAAEEQPASAPLPQPQAGAAVTWTAEPAPVTEDDEKLFAPASNWESLQQLVEEESEAPSASSARAEAIAEPEEMALPAPPQLSVESEEPPGASLPAPAALAEESLSAEEAVAEPSAAAAPPETLEETGPTVAPLDRITLEQLVRESIEEMLPQIVDRIARSLGISLSKENGNS
ncbi:MAG: response regulator [Acidobacteria bacterium]|nr:response regulator [Acidobacteriota bacterium]